MEIFNPHSNINFLGTRKISIAISAILLLVSIVAISTKGLNYALDFTGGVLVEVTYEQPVDAEQARQALIDAGIESPQVQSVGGARELVIRLQAKGAEGSSAKDDQVAAKVMAALKAKRPDATQKRTDFVGPQVGAELARDGAVAVIVVIIGIMIYIGLRFERRFAIAAIASEIHDTLLTVGFYALTQHEFDITVLASVLSVVGYSINDKVVVFDRVRELFRSARKGTSEEILNKAINSTLSRTIITSLFTGVTMIALYFFGGPVMHGFALTMIIGIVIGTLSSIFFANPILLWLGVSKQDLMPVVRDTAELDRRP
jgi:preprotein translocase subunit SecF